MAESHRSKDPASASPAIRRVLFAVLVLNAVLAATKVAIGLETRSIAVLGAAVESGLDTLNNIVGTILISVAYRAPDEDHPYGHAKFETVGALGIVVFLSISCFELARVGLVALISGGEPPRRDTADVVALIAALVVNGMVFLYEARRGRELGSPFLIADAAHTRSDMLVTLLALASLWVPAGGGGRLDGALALVVAGIIARSGYRILRESIPVLVDQRAVDAARLSALATRVPGVRAVRLARSRSTATGQLFAEITIAVAGDTSVDRAHAIADAVESAIGAEYAGAEVTVHIEPD